LNILRKLIRIVNGSSWVSDLHSKGFVNVDNCKCEYVSVQVMFSDPHSEHEKFENKFQNKSIYLSAEPIGSSAPKFPTESRMQTSQKSVDSAISLSCSAQGHPHPHYRFSL